MRRRYIGGGLLVVLLVAGVALFTLPQSVGSSDGPFEHGDSEQFVSSGVISVDGELLIGHEATVLADDNAHLRFEYRNGTVEYVYDGGTVYSKYETNSDGEEWLESRRSADTEVVHSGEHGDRLVLITKDEGTLDSSELGFVRATTIRALMLPEYERLEDRSDANQTVYAPSSAWIKSDDTLSRVEPESGELRTDRETGVLRGASLELSMTDASSYGEYLLKNDEDGTMTVTYEYDPNPELEDVDTPDWVGECVENNRCEF